MSNIAIQRTELLGGFLDRNAAAIRTVVATLILTALWVSFEPFAAGRQSVESASSDSGNLINQLGFTALFALSVFGCLTLVPPTAVARLFSLTWIVTLIMLAFSVTVSPEFDDAWRAYLLTLFGTVIAACVVILPANADSFSRVLLVAGGTVLALSYAGLVLFPEAAIHGGGGLEARHAGSWRGIFIHKNLAGPVMAILVFAGIYLTRRKMWVLGPIMTLAAAAFLYSTQSKASMALAPLVVVLVLLPSIIGMRFAGGLAFLAAIVGAHTLTVGTAFLPAVNDVLLQIDDSITFTGRTEIWAFARDYVLAQPWTGYGFDGFWTSTNTEGAEVFFDQTWDPRGIVHGHNGFIDSVLQFGIPVTLLVIWILVVAPAIAYVRTLPHRENLVLADFFLMVVAFALINASVESFFFRRTDPVWLTMVMAIFGLRMTSRFPVATR